MVRTAHPKVLVIGVDPSTLDHSDWGVTPEQNAGVLAAPIGARAGVPGGGLRRQDEHLQAGLVPDLRTKPWDVVVVGGGLRKSPELPALFERVVNAVHPHAPYAAIAFNTTPADGLNAAERWVGAR